MKRFLRICGVALLVGALCIATACQRQSATETPIYYFIDGFFVGSFEDGAFYSNGESYSATSSPYYFPNQVVQKEYTIAEVLAVEGYHLYRQDGHSDGKNPWAFSGQLLWDLSLGVSAFQDYDHRESLGKYATEYRIEGDSMLYHRFTLPTEIAQEDNAPIPKYNFQTLFFFEDNSFYQAPLATNGDFSCHPQEIHYDKGDDFAKGAMLNLMAESNLKKTAFNFTQFISADFDNDGELEYLTVDNTPTYDDGWPVADELTHGSHSALLYNDGSGKIDVLFACILPYEEIAVPRGGHPMVSIDHCYSIEVAGVYDLNNDGYLEICLRVSFWEGGYIGVLAYNPEKESFELVMQANYGL